MTKRYVWDEDLSLEVPNGWRVLETPEGFVQLVPANEDLGAVTVDVLRRTISTPPTEEEARQLLLGFVAAVTDSEPAVSTDVRGEGFYARASVGADDPPDWCCDVVVKVVRRRAIVMSYAYSCGTSQEQDATRAVVSRLL